MTSLETLVEPASVASVNGVLRTSIHLQMATFTLGDWHLTTRTFNGTLPGPTLLVNPGDTLIIDYSNDLPANTGSLPYHHNHFSAPEESNLHFHGLFVSGELPSDDATLVIKPGGRYTYNTTIPEQHMPGSHWMHPHRHGSTALQVGGGAASALVVQDTNDMVRQLPTSVTTSRQVILLVQEMNLRELQSISQKSQDTLLHYNGTPSPGNKFLLVNGQWNPLLQLQAGEWIRLRIIHAGWFQEILSLQIPKCEMQLIAKDGIYLSDLPRSISKATVVTAGRADIMVQCPDPDTTYSIKYGDSDDDPLVTLQTSSETAAVDSGPIVAPVEEISYPPYLSDLRETSASPGCSCSTRTGKLEYVTDEVLHTSYQGAIVERRIESRDHPYHQHVHPFQIISGFRGDDDDVYNHAGDWHDTVLDSGVMRYQPSLFTGKVMLHCHRLDHEDEGMMAVEYIQSGTTGGTCTCGSQPEGRGRDNDDFPVLGVALGAVAGVVLVMAVIAFLVVRKRKRSPTELPS